MDPGRGRRRAQRGPGAVWLRAAAVLAAALSPGLSRAQAAAAPAVRPNVVFVLADDLGYAELGSYGQERIRTPSLDRLAAAGMRFTQHYSGSAVCAPSRAVLLTGRHPGRNPIRDNRELKPEGQWPLPATELTLAEVVRGLGYATAAMGKWGLGPPGGEGDPLRQGFDSFFGYNCQRHAHDYYPAYLYDDARRIPLDNPEGNVYAPDRIWERARAFVRANRERPFLLYLPTPVPHLALQVPEDSLAQYRGSWPDPAYRGDKGYLPHPTPRAAYAAMVTRMDREVGSLLELLRELDLAQRTIVVFTSDNGPTYDRIGGSDSEFFGSSGPLRGLKGSLYEGGVRVPAIVSFAGMVAPGSVSDRVTGFEDWLPTLVELVAGPAAIPSGLDGVSFAPTLLGRPQPPRGFLYRELAGYGGQQSVRVGDWKGVRQGLGKPGPARLELYDLATDEGESKDVAAAQPEVAARLEAVLAREHQPSPLFPLAAIDPAASRYVALPTSSAAELLLAPSDAAWGDAHEIRWGPQEIATRFRALWSEAGLAVRFDVTDDSPWHTLTSFDAPLWTEEVVELFLDVGASSRSYAELEWNPVGSVVDLWVDRAENRFDRDWNVAGLESRVYPRRDAGGQTIGWTAAAILPWSALAAKAPAGTSLPPRPGDRWRFNVFRIERPGGPAAPERDARFLAWAPTGERSFHAPAAFRELEFAAPAAQPVGAAPREARAELAAPVCHEQARLVMGTSASVKACGPDPSLLAPAVAEALDELDRVDRLLSHYRPQSPLSRLNREAAHGPVAVEPELLEVLEDCLRWSRESDGAFDVTVGPLMKAWGFFRDEGRVPEPRELERARTRVGYRHVRLDRARGTVRFELDGVELDLGGYGKGYAVDRAVGRLRDRGVASALVNLGGSSLYALGAPPGEAAWEIGIQDPTRPDRKAASVSLRDRALSVSGGYARRFVHDGVAYSHVMDPRSGRPVDGVLSAAVLCARASDGDALDNVVLVQGLERARGFVARLEPARAAEVLLFRPAAAGGFELVRFSTAGAGAGPAISAREGR